MRSNQQENYIKEKLNEDRSPLIMPDPLEREIARARSLLKTKERDIPPAVLEVIHFLCSRNIGFILSRNSPVGSCREARWRRYRLGHIGIPLCDELKSIMGKIGEDAAASQFVAVHCRGDRGIDIPKLPKMFGSSGEFYRLDDAELFERFGMKYGTVNPFQPETHQEGISITQVFDEDVFNRVVSLPGTMMTNAGDQTWAVEFDPRELVKILHNARIGSVTIPNHDLTDSNTPQRPNPKPIGIITGNGPASGIALWSRINEEVKAILGSSFSGDLSLPEVSIVSAPAMGLSMELDKRGNATWMVLSDATQSLCNQGIKILCLACHTTHYFTPQIREVCRKYGVTFVSMVEVVIDYIRKNRIDEVALLGITHVANLGRWSAYSELKEVGVENLGDEQVSEFDKLCYRVKQNGPSYALFDRFLWLIQNQIRCRHVVIALTELSILLQACQKKTHKSKHVIIDGLQLYAKAVARASFDLPWQESHSEGISYSPP